MTEDTIILHHYTSAENFKDIFQQMGKDAAAFIDNPKGVFEPAVALRPSTGVDGVDAYFGPGVYLTDLRPDEWSREKIAYRLWDKAAPRMFARTRCWLKFEVPLHAVLHPKENTYLVSKKYQPFLKLLNAGVHTGPPVRADALPSPRQSLCSKRSLRDHFSFLARQPATSDLTFDLTCTISSPPYSGAQPSDDMLIGFQQRVGHLRRNGSILVIERGKNSPIKTHRKTTCWRVTAPSNPLYLRLHEAMSIYWARDPGPAPVRSRTAADCRIRRRRSGGDFPIL